MDRARSLLATYRRLVMIIVGCFVLAGCGSVHTDYGKVELAEVSGKVTLEGAPLANAVIIFESPDKTYSMGQTNQSGTYRLMFNSEKPGVTLGLKIIRIRTRGGLGEEGEDDSDRETGGGAGAEQVPACYNVNSKLEATVSSKSHTFNFDLKMDCSVTGPT